jgi:hypothetical protein
VEEAPSPKAHDQEVGLPVEVSVKVTVCPTLGALGANLNAAIGGATLTVTEWLTVLDPAVFAAVSVTVNIPAVAKAWDGFREVLVLPSPKLQDQELGLPVLVSVNFTDWPVNAGFGESVKDPVGAIMVLACDGWQNAATRITISRNKE